MTSSWSVFIQRYFEITILPYKIFPLFHARVCEEGKDKVISVRAMKVHGEVKIQLISFLASSLSDGEFSASFPGRFDTGGTALFTMNRGEGGCVVPRPGLHRKSDFAITMF